MLRLTKDKPVKVSVMIHPTEGCWRTTLAWLLKKYPEYFSPPNRNVWKYHGGSTFSSPIKGSLNEQTTKSLKAFGFCWNEVHHHFPYYGQYAPDALEWENVLKLEPSKSFQPWYSAGKVSVKKINDFIKMLNSYKVAPFIYIQCSGNGYKPIMEKEFSDSIAKSPKGKPYSIGINCFLLLQDN